MNKQRGKGLLQSAWAKAIEERRNRFYQRHVAEKMGINSQYLSAMERGERGRSFENFVNYCEAMDLNALELLGVSDSTGTASGEFIPVTRETAESFRSLDPSTQEIVIATLTMTIKNQKRLEEETTRARTKTASVA